MMKKFFCLALGLLSPLLSVTADEPSIRPQSEKGEFVLKGQRLNYDQLRDGEVSVLLTGFTGTRSIDVPVKDDGSFEISIPVTGIQTLTLSLARGRAIPVFTYPSDTIELNYDIMKVMNSFQIKGKNPERDRELQFCWHLYKKFTNRLSKLQEMTWNEKDTEKILAEANRYYNEKIDFIDRMLDTLDVNGFDYKFRQETYFETASVLVGIPGALERLDCRYPEEKVYRAVRTDDGFEVVAGDSTQYNKLSYRLFWEVPAYRSYLHQYLSLESRSKNRYFDNALITSPEADYLLGKALLATQPEILEWRLFHVISDGFRSNPYEQVRSIYDDFMSFAQNDEYRAELEQKHALAAALQVGQPAWDFELTDTLGNTVRLSDFRGKTVYLDFWGVGCGPCYYQFEHYTKGMKEKYREHDIVYVYICVVPSGDKYKEIIKEYDVKGIHLLAPGWTDHPVSQAYNVYSIPRYVLIDKEGNLVSARANNPSMLLRDQPNELDELLGIVGTDRTE